MRTLIRIVAAMQLTLIFPAALFLTAVFVAAGHNPQYSFGDLAQSIVMWYSARMWTLPLLLLALPFAVLVSGGAALLHIWKRGFELPHSLGQSYAAVPAPLATIFVAGTTLTSAGILTIVVLHMLAN